MGFELAKVSLIRGIGCPRELQSILANTANAGAIVIAANEQQLGKTSTGYSPRAVIIAGAAVRDRLLSEGYTRSWAWVEEGALDITADDKISCQELMEKLNSALSLKLFGSATGPMPGQPWPYIQEVYPFENYFIFSMKGQKYRQHYNLNPTERVVELSGGATAVEEKYVDAAGEIKETMPRVQTGVRYAFAPPRGNTQSSTTGAPNSELMIQVVRNWKNIFAAVNAYLDAIKNGLYKPMKPSFYPVEITDKGQVGAVLSAMGVDLFDFARWSLAAQKNTKEGLSKSKYAYAPGNDKSKWKLKIQDANYVRNALARINQTKGIPQSAKPGLLRKLRRLGKGKGIEVSDKPTGGQKSWMHKGVHA